MEEHKKTKRGYYEKQLTTNVVDDSGRKKRVTGLSKVSYEEACKDAENKKRELERLEKISIYERTPNKNEPFKNYISMFMVYKLKKVPTKRRWTAGTYDTNETYYNKYANSKIGNTQLKNLNVKMFQDFFDSLTLGQDLDPLYVKNIRMLAVMTFDYINRNICQIENYAAMADLNVPWQDEVSIDYDEGIDGDEVQVLTNDEIMRLYNMVIEEPTRYRYGWAVLLQLASGMRIQEVNALTLSCIDFDKKEILVNKSIGRRKNEQGKKECYIKTTKNRVIRKVFMDDNMVFIVKNILKYMPRNLTPNHRTDLIESGLIIYNMAGGLLDVDTYTGEFKRMCHYCGISLIPGVGARVLRHTWDSYNNIKNRNPIQILITAKAAGHTPQVDLQSYTHVTDDLIRENIKNPIVDIQKEDENDKELYNEFLQFKKWKDSQKE